MTSRLPVFRRYSKRQEEYSAQCCLWFSPTAQKEMAQTVNQPHLFIFELQRLQSRRDIHPRTEAITCEGACFVRILEEAVCVPSVKLWKKKAKKFSVKTRSVLKTKINTKMEKLQFFSRMVYAHEIILLYLNIFAIKCEFWRNASTSTQLTTLQKLMQFSFAGFLPQPRHCGSMNLWKP